MCQRSITPSTNGPAFLEEDRYMKVVTRPIAPWATGLTIVAIAIVAAAEAPLLSPQQAPGFYRGYLGTFEVVALSDGTAARRLDEILSDRRVVRGELAADHESEPVPLSINAYLINTGSHLVLIDTGAGELFGAASSVLLSNLRAAGYQPEQIDTILLTHIHADHSGGLSVGGVRRFPNATVYVDQRDVEYFVTRQDRPDEPDTLRRQVNQSRATIDPYLAAKKVAPITGNGEVIAGITSLSQPGHTPGHRAYLVQNSGHSLLVWGDVIHSSEVQFAHPSVTVVYDTTPSEAARTRMREFQFADDRGVVVASAHISFPGLGHVRKDGAGYRWVPIPYSATAIELDPKP
jgi:glyoxylase-like metal-dependent hydrolase (beta-lactamase superfamily II)